MNEDQDNLNVGDDNVVIGNKKGNIGDRNVIIDATDDNGNTILNKPMAIGHNAKAGPDSIAIGSNAAAGSDVFLLLNQLKEIADKAGDADTAKNIIDLIAELNSPKKNKSNIQQLWSIIQGAAVLNGSADLIAKIATGIISFL